MRKASAKPRPNISALASDESVCAGYVNKLVEVFKGIPTGDVEELNKSILEGIHESIVASCPITVPDKQHKPRENDELRQMIQSQHNKSADDLEEIRRSIKRKHSQLLNAYYNKKVSQLIMRLKPDRLPGSFKELKRYDKLHGGRGRSR